ncbi:aquaporin-11 isoform X1 [Neoarius graeffei]|uniref:aquaporin-11 isoform X1 n=1 Tax=Neoarius graeffei TaxID=443677 RepID=UPI00298CC615|nr:aquaporin-11 isoform X1 [Neoarius graeffei]
MAEKMADSRSRRLAGAADLLLKPPKITTTRPTILQSWVFIVFLLLLSIRHCFRADGYNHDGYRSVWNSQLLLFTKVLDNGQAKTPPTKENKFVPANLCRDLVRMSLMLLLAGDIELNPGPQPKYENILQQNQRDNILQLIQQAQTPRQTTTICLPCTFSGDASKVCSGLAIPGGLAAGPSRLVLAQSLGPPAIIAAETSLPPATAATRPTCESGDALGLHGGPAVSGAQAALADLRFIDLTTTILNRRARLAPRNDVGQAGETSREVASSDSRTSSYINVTSETLSPGTVNKLGGSTTGAVFNPALAFSAQFTCKGSTFVKNSLVYWLGPVLGLACSRLVFRKVILAFTTKSTTHKDKILHAVKKKKKN